MPDETFLASSEIADDAELGTKVSLETGHPVEWCSEENYLFRLTAFREQLLKWINTEPYRKLEYTLISTSIFNFINVEKLGISVDTRLRTLT